MSISRSSKVFVTIAFSCLSALAQSAPIEKGLFIQNGTKWDKLYPASVVGTKSTGIAKSTFTPFGLAKMHVAESYRDAHAPVATSSARPVFKVVGTTGVAPRDIIIVRLKEKKDHREVETMSMSMWTGVNMQYSPDIVTKVSVEQVEGGLLITPVTDLKPGEYLILTGIGAGIATGTGGSDFSVSK
jgi:hypothetical protein